MNVLINPDTGQVAYNSKGQVQQVPVWSSETNQFAEQAIEPVVTKAKNDTTLGENITDIDPEGVTTNLADEPTNGAIWTLHDGMPSVDQSDTAAVLRDSAFSYQFNDQNPGYGYSVGVCGVDSNRNVSFEAKNWYVRYLSLYIRYLDANDQSIKVSDLPTDIFDSFPLYDCCSEQNGEYDIFLDLVAPEWVILGIPTKTTTLKKTFPIPDQATSALVLAGGIGRGSNSYPATITPAAVMTGLFNLSFPILFLSLNAAAGVASLNEELQDLTTLLKILPLAIQLVADEFAAASYDDVKVFESLAVSVGTKLLTQAAKPLAQFVASALAEGETQEDLLDAIPVIGGFLAAIAVVGVITQVTETSVQVAQSPHTYVGKINFTHDIEVTIKHDPNDPEGFPATATHYIVTATFDQGTPYTMTQDLPGTTVTEPITATFMSVPYGGMVTVNVGFYSDNQWLAGNGSVGPVENVSSDQGPLSVEITITENLVPLESDTVYSHKEIIVLDAQGNHQWEASTDATGDRDRAGGVRERRRPAVLADRHHGEHHQRGGGLRLAVVQLARWAAAPTARSASCTSSPTSR